LFVHAVKDLRVERVLDVGCGAGTGIHSVREKTECFCVGDDAAAELAQCGGFSNKRT
jgi:16S rRNA G1207 methylase RsmC